MNHSTMATDVQDPIVIDSDESDNDDVVLIKEEIEVDSDDVIFLSEDKPTPPTAAQDNKDGCRGMVSRSNSLATCANQLSLEDSEDSDSDEVALVLPDNPIPLDLSAKSASNSPGPGDNPAACLTDDTGKVLQQAGATSGIIGQLSDDNTSGNSAADDSKLCLFQDTKWLSKAVGHSLEMSDNKLFQWLMSTDTDNNLDLTQPNVQTSQNSAAPDMLQNTSTTDASNRLLTPIANVANDAVDTLLSTSISCSNNNNNNAVSTNSPLCSNTFTFGNPTAITTAFSVFPGGGITSPTTATNVSDPTTSSIPVSVIATDKVDTMRNAMLLHSMSALSPCTVMTSHVAPAVTPVASVTTQSPLLGNPAGGQGCIQSQSTGIPCHSSGQGYSGGLLGGFQPCATSQGNQSTILHHSASDSGMLQSKTISSSKMASSTPHVPVVKRSLSSSDQMCFYNSLTLPLYQNNLPYKRSVSTSGMDFCLNDTDQSGSHRIFMGSSATNQSGSHLNNSSQNQSNTSSAAQCTSAQSSYIVPPKKQKRCYSNNGEDGICTACRVNILGEKSSRCINNHATCTICLEEKVKLVLTGKAKESVKCLNSTCDSYYTMVELRRSLPAMVVEILEDRLDPDYIDCIISDMILKNATEETDEAGDNRNEHDKYVKKFDDCPDHWIAMDEREVNKKGYVLVPLEFSSKEYQTVQVRFFDSMVDHNVEVTGIYRVQNPIQWKYYTVKKSEMMRDNEGFQKVVEGSLFHGTSSSAVDAICRKGFDWRLSGKHGTMYGEGSYFAVDASYSHQYTDLRGHRHLHRTTFRSSMSHPHPMMLNLPTPPPTPPSFKFLSSMVRFSPINHSNSNNGNQFVMQYSPMNLSHNAQGTSHNSLPPSQTAYPTGSLLQQTSSQNAPAAQTSQQLASSSSDTSAQLDQQKKTNSQSVGSQPGTSVNPVCNHFQCSLTKCHQTNKMLAKPVVIKHVCGLPSSALTMKSDITAHEPERRKAKMFFARVLVGQYTNGAPKMRKPPPLYNTPGDHYGKCYDSCVDNEDNPRIFVIFDNSQAYPEYMVEYEKCRIKGWVF